MKIIKLNFKKDKENKIILTDKGNLEKLLTWVIPIIERNDGWGTGKLTRSAFIKNPKKFQKDIDATVWGNVHIATKDDKPLALLEYTKTNLDDKSKERHKIVDKLLSVKNANGFGKFEKLV